MKRKSFVVFAAALMALCLVLAACGKAGEPEVRVAVQSQDNGETDYYTVYDNGSIKSCDEFKSAAVIYSAGPDDFESDVVNGKVTVRVTGDMLTDADGNETKAEGLAAQALSAIGDVAEHDVIGANIAVDGDDVYVSVALNVNLQSPYILYKLDDGTLVKLCEFDNAALVGVQEIDD